MQPIRVLIVDDHPVVRTGIRSLVELETDIQVVGEASSGLEALRLVAELLPDILLLDMELPDIAGNVVAGRIHEQGLRVRILALSGYDDKQYVLELLARGAAGYLLKEEVPDMIVEAIRGIARGEIGWISRRIAAQMTAWMREEPGKASGLTPREIEVLRAIVAGKTNQEIASGLGIRLKTVEKHIEMIFNKLGVSSRVEAAVRAVRESLV